MRGRRDLERIFQAFRQFVQIAFDLAGLLLSCFRDLPREGATKRIVRVRADAKAEAPPT